MPERAAGKVAFLFTDLEGSTRLWEHYPETMPAAYARHDTLLRAAVEGHGGVVYKVVGDAFQIAFPTVAAAVAAAIAAQRALTAEAWPAATPLRVRMALHLCEVVPQADGDYRTPALNRLGRLLVAGHGGQIVLSAAIAEHVRASDQGLPPGSEVRDLGEHRFRDLSPEHVYQLIASDLPVEFPPLASLKRHRHNLPPPLTTFVGRTGELAAARALLDRAEVRLMTLTGPGGTGKTRLALQLAAELAERLEDGAWFVPLAAIADPALVLPTVARTLGVHEPVDQAIAAALADFLEAREMLLVLDNFEQVVAAAPVVTALLQAAPKLKILATSRVALRLSGEHEFPVAPLALPDLPAAAGRSVGSDVREAESVQLFVERARAIRPDFALDAANATAVAAICRRLDGLPLAIELAAARVRLLPPPTLLERLVGARNGSDQEVSRPAGHGSLNLLTGGPRDLPDRQRTLRAAIAWSYDLLRPAEQIIFARLAVFAGGGALAAAEAVCADDGTGAVAGESVLDLLLALTEQSLLWQEERTPGSPRLRMLETIQEYARERLEERGEGASCRERHAEYFLALAERAEPELAGGDQSSWFERLDDDLDNFRAALTTFDQQGSPEALPRLAAALWRFWWFRGYLGEGRTWLERALDHAAAASPVVRARLLDCAGALAEAQGEDEMAMARHTAALALWREVGDRRGMVQSLINLGIVAQQMGDPERAREHHDAALALARAASEPRGMAVAIVNLGFVALDQGDRERATTCFEESMALFRTLADWRNVSVALSSLGVLAFSHGEYARAAAIQEEAVTLLQDLGDRPGGAEALVNLGHTVHRLGDFDRAERLVTDALELFRELGDTGGTADALIELGRMTHERGDLGQAMLLLVEGLSLAWRIGEKKILVEAIEALAALYADREDVVVGVRLLGAAASLRETIGVPRSVPLASDHERTVAVARQALGEAPFQAAWEEGRRLVLEYAVTMLTG